MDYKDYTTDVGEVLDGSSVKQKWSLFLPL